MRRQRAGVSCPRCGEPPLEVTTFSDPDPMMVPRCRCYPHPPLCISCRRPLVDERCENLECATPFVIQPEPIVDPLWPTVLAQRTTTA